MTSRGQAALFAALATVLLLLLGMSASPAHAAKAGRQADGYFHGRATFYTDNKQGSCHYKTDIPSAYAAWPDTQEGFGNSCGTCWEVSCVNSGFNDGFGQWVDRTSGCYDESKAITVKIVDSCPCVHENFYSNQRWCCGDSAHIDLADTVFAQLAKPSLGVVAARWRQVNCDQVGRVVHLGPNGAQPTHQQQPNGGYNFVAGSGGNGQQPGTGQSDFWKQSQQQFAQAQAQFAKAQQAWQGSQPLPQQGWQSMQPMQPMQPMPSSFGNGFPQFGWGRRR